MSPATIRVAPDMRSQRTAMGDPCGGSKNARFQPDRQRHAQFPAPPWSSVGGPLAMIGSCTSLNGQPLAIRWMARMAPVPSLPATTMKMAYGSAWIFPSTG